jgi:hypothetical protein
MAVDDDSGWQVVKPGKRGRANLAAILAQEAAAGDQSLAPTTSVLDVPAIAADHELLCARWKESTSFRNLCTVISGNAAGHKEIKTAICLGLGSFDVRSNAPRHGRIQHDAHVQLEAFRTIVGILGSYFAFVCMNICPAHVKNTVVDESMAPTEKNGGHPIKCYAQEPSFGPSDKDYCRSIGIEVVDNPEAFRYVGSDAFVFAIHLPTLLWGLVFEKHLPALCVGTSLSSLEE